MRAGASANDEPGSVPAQPEGGDNKVLTKIRARFAREEGQTMAEYAVVLAVITVATVAVFTALSGGIQGAISNVTGIL
jgi:Flp pilus assembly pilin Flp